MTQPFITVFCASRPGNNPQWQQAAYDTGKTLADNGFGVVYGGGGGGSMGALAQGALDAGGEVIGVIPQSMIDREWGRHDLTRLEVVETMHERKARMAQLGDAFLVLPGGIGTLEEFFEVWTWRTLGYLPHRVGVLDVGGFWQPMLAMLQRMVDGELVSADTFADLIVTTDAAAYLDATGLRGR
ncbi:TIGR00730 family Rossman fold protein [Calidifontibacter sp. DB0510]|uniref:Cytokinin riboside 5'-monophosphate phosphoribohydrolase n=1 Tax=Metallococcus carri TaxID=1656884 RepID=A0A967B1R1_9MICO|nr:TIGR00730 family Rossman fold protein [Metallococcus carri]NHN57209.1 TIGR00730 family Rossman fold protein [Metallococcus carri]NOP37988.1 TIGR00730 family Rossman fold protein [Calidifontibacter sp. DB2511S]